MRSDPPGRPDRSQGERDSVAGEFRGAFFSSQGFDHLSGPVQHELHFAVDGDELPAVRDAFFGLLDAVGVDAGGDSEAFAAGEDLREGLIEGLGGRGRAVRCPHGGGEVVRPDEDGIDTADAINLVEIPDGVNVLALKDDQDFIVETSVILGR